MLAAKFLKMDRVPVIFQDFKDIDQEIAFGIADNAIAAWADLDLAGVNDDLQNLGPDFDLDMLGIKNFALDVSDKDPDAPAPPPPARRCSATRRRKPPARTRLPSYGSSCSGVVPAS